MAKEKSAEKEQRKKEKKASKEKRSEIEGVHKSKKDKKDKKEKREKRVAAATEDIKATTKVLNAIEEQKPGSVVIKEDGNLQVKIKSVPLLGALVPFANPLADEKAGKKVLKTVKKGRSGDCPNVIPCRLSCG